MNTTQREKALARGQMELPLGIARGGQAVGHYSRRLKAPQHVADWWFARVREWTMETVTKPERGSAT